MGSGVSFQTLLLASTFPHPAVFPVPTVNTAVHLHWKTSWIRKRTWWHVAAAHEHLRRWWKARLERASTCPIKTVTHPSLPKALFGSAFCFSKGSPEIGQEERSSASASYHDISQFTTIRFHCFFTSVETLELKCVCMCVRINSSPWKRQLTSCWQYLTCPNPLVGEGAGETGVKSILFGEYNFSGLSKSLSLCKHKILPSFSIWQYYYSNTPIFWRVEMDTFKHLAGKAEIKTKSLWKQEGCRPMKETTTISWLTERFPGSYKTSTHGNTLPGSSSRPMTGLSAFLLGLP